MFPKFGMEEPGADSEIRNCLAYVRPGTIDGKPFQPLFPLAEKTEVNGEDEDNVYTYLKVNFQPLLS